MADAGRRYLFLSSSICELSLSRCRCSLFVSFVVLFCFSVRFFFFFSFPFSRRRFLHFAAVASVSLFADVLVCFPIAVRFVMCFLSVNQFEYKNNERRTSNALMGQLAINEPRYDRFL